MIVAISCRLQPASESRVTAVPLRSWNVSPEMPAARVASAQAFLKLLSFHGLPVELVSMIGEVVGVASLKNPKEPAIRPARPERDFRNV